MQETTCVAKKLEDAWQERWYAAPFSPFLMFAPEGLVLGVGTVVVAAEGQRQLQSLKGREASVLALLSAAYGKAVPISVIGNIKRAAKAWSEGDDCLAYIHLAHARLPVPDDLYETAHRLFIADSFMKAGTSPSGIFEALHLSSQYINAVEKTYNPAESRVPAGSGRTSGEWTRDESATGRPTSPAALADARGGRPLAFLPPATAAAIEAASEAAPSVLAELSGATAASLGQFASGLLLGAGGATAAFGLLFIPSPNRIEVAGDVPEIPGLHYSWKRDEAFLRLTYDNPDGSSQSFTAELQEDVFRDQRGRVVGRVLPNGDIAFELSALPSVPVKDDEPKLCPKQSPDRRTNDKGLEYENYIKSIVNPQYPTPPRMGYFLANEGKGVVFEDCEHLTGTMIDAKDQYAGLLRFPAGLQSVAYQFADESKRQVDAAGARGVRWYFAEEQTAEFTKELFRDLDEGREKIDVIYLPGPGKTK